MLRGRARKGLAGGVVVAVLLAAGMVIERRRQSSADDRTAARVAAEQAAAQKRAATDRASGSGETDGSDTTGGGNSGGLLKGLLDALGGGGTAGGGATGALLANCSTALAGAPGGRAGLLPDRKNATTDTGAQLRAIAAALEELRGLQFTQVPDPVYVSAAEMTERVQAEVAKSLAPEAAANEARALISIGALPPGADLQALTLQALGEQVAGYYDPATGELVVGRSGRSGRLDGQTRIVLAHELDHALTDQALDLPVEDGQPPPGTEDAALARLALVEGDATLAMQLYGLAFVPLLEQLSGLSGALASLEQLDRLPYHLQRNLTFPYIEGLSFACALHDAGGWPAVDKAYKATPATTAQVLFPERYLAGEAAVDPRDPVTPGSPWKALPRRALGAAELQWLLEAPGGDSGEALGDPATKAGGWAGGELQVWTDGDRTTTGVALVQHAGQPSLCTTMAAWYAAAFPGGTKVELLPGEELAIDGARQDAVIRCAGTDVRIGIAPDLATARTVAG